MLRVLPRPLLIGVAAIAGVAMVVVLAKGLSDPDFFWHLTTGRLILDERAIPTADPYSFTWYGQPWIDHEWLGQVGIALLVDTLGAGACAVVLTVLPIVAISRAALALRTEAITTPALLVAVAVVVAVLVPWLTLRPQVFSWALLALLLALLLSLRAEAPRRALLLIPLFVLWANVHGLWIVGLGIVVIYLVATLLNATPMRAAKGHALLAAAGSAAATAFTPAGLMGVLYPLRYVDAGDWGREHIAEWQSPNFHDPANLPFLLLIVMLLALRFRGSPRWLTATAAIGVVAGLVSVRNVPVAAILSFPALAISIAAWLPPAAERRRPPSAQVARRLIELGVAALIVAVAALTVLPYGRIDLEAHSPVAAVDRLVNIDPGAKVFAQYQWGGYLIYRLHATGGRVFVDGRNDMYPDAILRSYQAAHDAVGDWQRTLDAAGTAAILLPPDAPLVRGPAQTAGWCEAYRDAEQVLLLKNCPAAK